MALSTRLHKSGCGFLYNSKCFLPPAKSRRVSLPLALAMISCLAMAVRADTVGSISGTVTDQTGAVIPDTTVTALNLDTTVQQTTKTNANGFYNFTALPVGRYEIEILRDGFEPYKRTGLVIDVNSQLRADITLSMGAQSEEVVVSDTSVHVETESTQVGEVVSGDVMTGVALNGRSFTDLMSLQPGIVPMSTQTPDSVVMAGATVAIAPSGRSESRQPVHQRATGGRQRISGQRRRRQGVDERRHAIIPDLDSISEFRVLDQQFRRGIRQLCRRHRERGDQERDQSDSRQRLRIPAQHRSRCEGLLCSAKGHLSTKSVRRHGRWARSRKASFSFLETIKEPGTSKVWRRDW